MFEAFLDSLADNELFSVSPRDRRRLSLVLSTPGAGKTLPHVRAILRSVLASSATQQQLFDRRFDDFFHETDHEHDLDATAALRDLLDVSQQPEDVATKHAQPTTPAQAAHKTDGDKPQPRADDSPIPQPPDRPRLELLDEQPLLTQMADEDIGRWLNELEPLKFDLTGPVYFSTGMICPERPPMLGEPQLQEAADSLGFYRSETLSTDLDVPRSIETTLSLGGVPTARFQQRRRLLSVLLLVDTACHDLRWNTVPDELAAGLARRGVAVSRWTFYAVPDRFEDERGRVMDLEDLEEWRRQWIVLLITDGHGMWRPNTRRPLERMSRWPRVAWLDPQHPDDWDWSIRLSSEYGLSLFPCNDDGLIACLRNFTSERGVSFQLASRGVGFQPASRGVGFQLASRGVSVQPGKSRKLEAYATYHNQPAAILRGRFDNDADFLAAYLGLGLELAQVCALLPVTSLGLAEQLRRRFFPDVEPDFIAKLLNLSGTRLDWCGFRLSQPNRDALLHGFIHQPEEERHARTDFVLSKFDEVQEPRGHDISRHALASGSAEDDSNRHQTEPDANACRLMGDASPSLFAAQLRFFRHVVQSIGFEDAPDVDQFSRIWQARELTRGLDVYMDQVLDHVQAPPIRKLARYRLRPAELDDTQQLEVPENLARIPAGKFWMGDPSDQGDGDEKPRHEVFVSEFFLEQTPVTWQQWQAVRNWAKQHGYEFEGDGAGNGDTHPAQSVSWFDAVKWCNARSEMEGLEPAYFTDTKHESVYRAGEQDLKIECVSWDANGYRLPTEAEWEKAARGGLDGHHFPWESPGHEKYEQHITAEKANYNGGGRTSSVTDFEPNAYGLFDMAGNVREWCWDFWDEAWYGNENATTDDTRGPTTAAQRVYRGGSWANGAGRLRCSYRDWDPPGFRDENRGFRVARGRLQPAPAQVPDGSGGVRDEPREPDGPSERSERADFSARILVIGDHPDQLGEVRLESSHFAPFEFPFNTTVPVPKSGWTATCTSPGCEPATLALQTLAHTQRTYQVLLAPQVPDNLTRIPAGKFWLGDPSDQGYDDEKPRHQVFVSEFFMEKTPVTWTLWQDVREWASQHGYQFENTGQGKGDDHPVQDVSWYDAVKWCNARSEMEGLEASYFEGTDHESVYRTGEIDLEIAAVNWQSAGYRLPTEAEWEKAARGGLDGHHFPWESPGNENYQDLIAEARANYANKLSRINEVNQFEANGYGLFDMAGNVWEWCWDFGDDAFYGNENATADDTRGPITAGQRVNRGGSWADVARFLRCSYRGWNRPGDRYEYLGFRVARGRLQPAQAQVPDGSGGVRDEPREPDGLSERSGF